MNSFGDRSQRALVLADRFPASAEILNFYVGVANWQASKVDVAGFEGAGAELPSLVDLVDRTGPEPLRESGRELSPEKTQALMIESWEKGPSPSPDEFFVRTLLQLYAATLPDGLDCPWCARPPLVGSLSTLGDGQAYHLTCALCFRRRAFMRATCPGCGETDEKRQVTYSTEDFPHLRLKACDTCHGYVIAVDLERDVEAIPEVDDLAGLPLDLWAFGAGYHRLVPNLGQVG